MPGNLKDRYGMTLSTNSPDAADRWQEGIDLLLSQSYGAEEKLQEAIDLEAAFEAMERGETLRSVIRIPDA